MKTEILYEDEDILVVYKPAGFAVQTAGTGQMDMVSELKNYLKRRRGSANSLTGGGAPYLGVIHRLDQPVEGLLVFAGNKKAAASLSKQLQNQENGGSFHKHYYAALCGCPFPEEGELVDFLYKNEDNKAIIVKEGEMPEAKRAVLQYHILQERRLQIPQYTAEAQNDTGTPKEAIAQNETGAPNEADAWNEADVREQCIALADIHIQTGRFHQIRTQMAHAGVPILGDLKYGNAESKVLSRRLNVQSPALCAYSLAFLHPISQKRMNFQAKPRAKIFSMFEGMN